VQLYEGSRARADKRKILHFQYTLHNDAEGTGYGTCELEGLPAESKSNIRDDYGQQ